jgi:hypothetical protein
MSDPLIEFLTLGLAAVAVIVVLALASNVSRLRQRLAKAGIAVEDVPGEEAPEALSPELIAVITAAVAAASGLGTHEFRVLGVNRVEGSGSWNTPIWGHIDRLIPRSNHR